MRRTFTKICMSMSLMALPGVLYGKTKVDTIFTSDGVDVYLRKKRSNQLKWIAELRLADLESSIAEPGRTSTGVNFDYFLKRYGSFSLSTKGAYLGLVQNAAFEESKSQNEILPFMCGSAGVRAHFLDGRGEVMKKVTLSVYDEFNEDGSPHTAIRYFRAKYPCRRIMAIRAGYFYYNSPVSADMNGNLLKPDVAGSLTTESGDKFIGKYYTNSRTNGFYVGYTRIRNINIMVSSNVDTFEGKGRHVAFYRELYADILFGAKTTFDPLVVKGAEYAIVPNAPGSFRTQGIGFRVGGRAMSRLAPGTLGGFYEIGMRPGILVRGLYASVGFTFTIIK